MESANQIAKLRAGKALGPLADTHRRAQSAGGPGYDLTVDIYLEARVGRVAIAVFRYEQWAASG
jgi:hypothetical protein